MSSIRQFVRLGQSGVRNFATSQGRRSMKAEDTKTYKKLKEHQEIFQNEGGPEEVFLRGGVSDKLLYRFTFTLSIFGVYGSLVTIYNFSQK